VEIHTETVLEELMDSELNQLQWTRQLLPDDMHFAPKHGGLGCYQDMNLVLILVESPSRTYEHKGVKYPFDLWRGCIFPIEQKKQNAFFLKYLFLENHPANKNWLYIPLESENFEEEVKLMLREITKRNPLLGLPVKSAEKSTPRKKSLKKVKASKKSENAFLLGLAERKRS
jgi:hypothetical protein